MFGLTREEKEELVTICDRFRNLKHSTVLPHAFTEHGAMMAANVLHTQRAIDVSIFVVRAFARLREIVSAHRELAQKLEALERKFQGHDVQIQSLFDAIRQLMAPVDPKRHRIGFR
ncbi:MAG: hypothetical protein HY590_04450 [Candidatus Omnitrophica bacterium]|nr:hypothetical protein [Candidatus Omnitrophota bacterium]